MKNWRFFAISPMAAIFAHGVDGTLTPAVPISDHTDKTKPQSLWRILPCRTGKGSCDPVASHSQKPHKKHISQPL